MLHHKSAVENSPRQRKTGVLIVDDQRSARMGLSLMVNRAPDLETLASVENGKEAIEWLRNRKSHRERMPDIILMDIWMPELNGIEATAEVTRQFPQVKTLVMTTYDQDDYAFGALDAGATGYLLKDVRSEELHRAIRAIVNGDAVLSPRVTSSMIQQRPRKPTKQKSLQAKEAFKLLSPREFEVAELIAQGLNNAEIAERLVIQPSSVKKTVTRILNRMGIRDRIQIVVLWYESGLGRA
ncbi:response regulator transcription factor [Corynebacterium camporealensis]